MTLPPDRNPALNFYRAPDRATMRREVGAFLRWLRRPPGLLWLAVYAVVVIGSAAVGAWLYRAERFLFFRWSDFLVYPAFLFSWIMGLGLWAGLMQRRTMAPFQRERLADVMLSELGPRELFPGLLAAPALWMGTLICFDWIALHVGLIWGALTPAMHLTVTVPRYWGAFPFGGEGAGALLFWTLPTFDLLFQYGTQAAATAFAAWGAFPRGGLVRLIGWFAGGYALIYLLRRVVIIFARAVRDFLGLEATLYPMNFAALEYFVVFMSMLIAALVWRWSLRRLHGDRMWERLRKCAERG